MAPASHLAIIAIFVGVKWRSTRTCLQAHPSVLSLVESAAMNTAAVVWLSNQSKKFTKWRREQNKSNKRSMPWKACSLKRNSLPSPPPQKKDRKQPHGCCAGVKRASFSPPNAKYVRIATHKVVVLGSLPEAQFVAFK